MNVFGLPSSAVLVVVALTSAAGAAWTTREVYTGKIAKMDLATAQAVLDAAEQARQTQKKIDGYALRAAVADAEAQVRIVTQTKTIVKEIPRYVPDTSACVTVGLVRVLDAAALGADPASLPLGPGEFNETCAGIGSHALAESVAENYGRARADAAQLTGLQAVVRKYQAQLSPSQ